MDMSGAQRNIGSDLVSRTIDLHIHYVSSPEDAAGMRGERGRCGNGCQRGEHVGCDVRAKRKGGLGVAVANIDCDGRDSHLCSLAIH
ncbi:hypothetical protein D3C72_1998460 [compost metagenome]